MWDTRFTAKVEALYGKFSVSIHLSVRGRGLWWFSSVYGVPHPLGCESFFDENGGLWGLCSPGWIFGADFNAVRYMSEKKGGDKILSRMVRFDSCICGYGLVDLPSAVAQFA